MIKISQKVTGFVKTNNRNTKSQKERLDKQQELTDSSADIMSQADFSPRILQSLKSKAGHIVYKDFEAPRSTKQHVSVGKAQ